ncbi:MAG: BACON domain-containing carbohydrate-binding protein [Rikenellaceae bacterium]
MKKIRFSLMSLFVALFLAVSCSEDATTTTPPIEVEDPTLSIQVSETDVTTIDLTANRSASAVVSVVTNQDLSTVTASLDASSADWCKLEISAVSKTITLTALSENTTGVVRTATLTVVAGEGETLISDSYSVIQDYSSSSSTLSLTSTLVQFHDYAAQTEEVYVTTNQTAIAISGLEGNEYLSAELDGKIITIKTLKANETDEAITATLTVTVGEGSTATSEDITISQAAPEAAKLYVSTTSILFTSMTTEFTESIIVTTNMSYETISTAFTGTDASEFTAEVVGNVVTVVGEKNLAGRDYTATLTISVGTGANIATKTVDIYQEGAIEFELLSTSETLAYSAGSIATVTVSSNFPAEISASVAPAYEDYFSVSVGSVGSDSAVVTITALKDRVSSSSKTFSYSDAINVAVYEGQENLERTGSVSLVQECLALSVGTAYGDGIVYSVSSSQAMLLYKKEGGRLIWATSDTTMIDGALDTDDGESNTAAIKAYGETLEDGFAANFPACYWCTSLGDGWYFPAENEIVAFLTYLTDSSFTSALSAAGADAMTSGEFYWASNGDTDTAGSARAIRNSSGSWSKGSYGKTSNTGRYTRAVKKVTLE